MTNSVSVIEQRGPLSAFRYPNFRYLWSSNLGATIAVWMDLVVIGWLVLELTNSPALVGLAGACRFAGTGLGPFLGAIADRFNRKRILLIVRGAGMGYPLILALLYYFSLLQVWHIFILVFYGSFVMVFNMTTVNALAADVVERRSLTSAVGMIGVGMGITTILGPLVGGYLYAYAGVGGCFLIMAAAYLYSCIALVPMRFKASQKPDYSESVSRTVIVGITYVWNDRSLLTLMIFAAITNFFIFPCTMVLMPVFARDVLDIGTSSLGWLLAAQGLGRLVGAFLTSALGEFRHKGWLLVGLMIVSPILLGSFATTHVFSASVGLIVMVGLSQSVAMVLIQILLLTWSSEEFRGRVMGVRMFVIVFEAAGSLIAGALANLWGIATVMVVNAVACVFTVIFTTVWAPELRQRQE